MIDRELLSLLACPACLGALREAEPETLACEGCGLRYRIEAGVPVLLAGTPAPQAWQRKQELGLAEYERDGRDPYADEVARAFAAFCGFKGRVLDVGCGIEPEPAYHCALAGARFVGVDPLAGPVARSFPFVQAMGERLPFRDDAFDAAVLATSLDHVPEPSEVLAEVRRVLGPGGALGLWSGVLDTERARAELAARYARPALSPGALGRFRGRGLTSVGGSAVRHLVVNPVLAARTAVAIRLGRTTLAEAAYPERAEHHFHFFGEGELVELVEASGFRVLRRRRLADAAHGDSLFLVAEAGSA